MENKKNVSFKLSEKNWMRAKQKAAESGISLSAWIAARVEEALEENDAFKKLSHSDKKTLQEIFPGIHKRLRSGKFGAEQWRPAIEKIIKKTSGHYLHSGRVESTAKNLRKHAEAAEPALRKMKKAAKDSVQAETWENSSKQLHEEFRTLEPYIEKIKKTSRDFMHSEPLEEASRQFSEKMKTIEKALNNLIDKNKEDN